MTTTLVLDGLRKSFGAEPVVDGISLSVEQGEFLTLLGPSGCGKTTTLNLVAGFLSPDAGRIAIGGRDVTNVPPHHWRCSWTKRGDISSSCALKKRKRRNR